ncbi:MAG: acyltransferase [Gammaproteobacteria bacterium]|nr:acyltransferase [Gammaproteobacteria bacterium]
MSWIDRLLSVPTSSQRLGAMEGLRGYAALLIYVLHLTGQFFSRRLEVSMDDITLSSLAERHPLEAIGYWLFSSHYGVDIFFALSGYLIAGIVTRQGFRYGPYLVNRLLRIYPVLICSTFIYVAYRIFVNGGTVWWGGLVGNLLLLNGIAELDFPAINIVTWSLFFEISFYLAFPIIWMACRQRLGRFTIVFLGLVAVLAVCNDNYSRYAMFGVGILLKLLPAPLLAQVRSRFSDISVAVLYVAAAAVFMATQQFVLFLPVFAIPAFLLMDRAIHSDGWLNQLFSNRWLRYFGNISFSFYIYHPLGLSVAHAVLERYPGWTHGKYLAGFIVLSFASSTVFAVLSYVFVERLYFSSRRHALTPRPQQA